MSKFLYTTTFLRVHKQILCYLTARFIIIKIMSIKLIAESGSTKTDWCLVGATKKNIKYKTSGINPYLQTEEDIINLLENELKLSKYTPDSIHFYGAGLSSDQKQNWLKKIFKKHFKVNKIEVNSDMLAAARGLCNKDKGIVVILGTGSNTCYFNGKTFRTAVPSLGYIAGDEGSGNHMGKRVLRYYAYNMFDEELKATFESMFGNDLNVIKDKLYKEPFANRYLGSYTQLLSQHRGHFMVENIIEDSFIELFSQHILKYRESWRYPVNFTGSVAYEFRDVLKKICQQYELTFGKVQRSPLKGLVEYHTK